MVPIKKGKKSPLYIQNINMRGFHKTKLIKICHEKKNIKIEITFILMIIHTYIMTCCVRVGTMHHFINKSAKESLINQELNFIT